MVQCVNKCTYLSIYLCPWQFDIGLHPRPSVASVSTCCSSKILCIYYDVTANVVPVAIIAGVVAIAICAMGFIYAYKIRVR